MIVQFYAYRIYCIIETVLNINQVTLTGTVQGRGDVVISILQQCILNCDQQLSALTIR